MRTPDYGQRVVFGLGAWWSVVAAMVGAASSSWAQTGLVYDTEDDIHRISDMFGNVPAYVDGGKVFPLEPGGDYRFEGVEEFSALRGELQVIYTVVPAAEPDQSEVEYVKVNADITFKAKRDLENAYLVWAWVDDGQLSDVTFRRIDRMAAWSSWNARQTISMRRERSDGYLWCGVFKNGFPVAYSGAGKRVRSVDRLRDALRAGRGDEVERLLAEGIRWSDLEGEDGEWLALNGRLDWLQRWCATQSSWKTKYGPEMLWRAVSAGREPTVRWLLKNGVDPEKGNDEYLSILKVAIDAEQWELLRLLLQHRKGDWNYGSSSMAMAASRGRRDIVELLKDAGIEWPRNQRVLQRALMAALERKSLEGVRLLLEGGAQVHGKGTEDMVTFWIIRKAISLGDLSFIDLILNTDPDLKRLDENGFPVIPVAILEDRVEVLDRLIDGGANPHVLVKNGAWDLVAIALDHGSIKCAERLIGLGVIPITLPQHAAVVWGRSLATQRSDVAVVLRRLGIKFYPDRAVYLGLMEQAIAENFEPMLSAALDAGWTGDTDLNHGWNVAGLAAYYGLAVPAELLSATQIKTGPALIDTSASPRVVKSTMPRYPKDRWLSAETGEATVSFLVDETGKARYAKVLSASADDFGLAAQRAAELWELSPLPEGVTGWRRVVVPMAFRPIQDAEEFVDAGDLDQFPVPKFIAPIVPPEGAPPDEMGVAQVSLILDLNGDVMLSEIDLITHETWRESVTQSLKRWQYQPAIDGNRAVKTKIVTAIRYPASQIVPAEGIALKKKPGQRNAVFLGGRVAEIPESRRASGGIALSKVVVDRRGRMQSVDLLACSHPDLREAVMNTARRWRFKPALSNGEPIEQELYMTTRWQPRK